MVAREVVSIQPQVSGRITNSLHRRRRRENRRTPVYHRSAPLSSPAQSSRGQSRASPAGLSLAKANFARVESLSDPRAVSRQDYDTKKNAVDSGEAAVQQNRAAVETRRLNLEYCTIRSPIDGRAGQRVDAGNVVSANNSSLLVIQRLDPIYADFTVTESELGAVQRNMAKRTFAGRSTLAGRRRRRRARETSLFSTIRFKKARAR